MKTRKSDKYVMLLASLPNPDASFKDKQPPVSRLTLERRLRMLTPTDADRLRMIERLLDWRTLKMDTSLEELAHRERVALEKVNSTSLKEIIVKTS